MALWRSVVPTFQKNVMSSFSGVEKFDPLTLEDEGTTVGTRHSSDTASYPGRRGSSRHCCGKPNPAYFQRVTDGNLLYAHMSSNTVWTSCCKTRYVQSSRMCVLDSLCAVQSSLYVNSLCAVQSSLYFRLCVCSPVFTVCQAQISAPHPSRASKQHTHATFMSCNSAT